MTTEPRDALEAEARAKAMLHSARLDRQDFGQSSRVSVLTAIAAMLAYRDQVRREVVETNLARYYADNCACRAAERYVPTCPEHGTPKPALSAAAPGEEP